MCALTVAAAPPEMELFKHAMPLPAFYQTVMGAKRWSAAEALEQGTTVGTVSFSSGRRRLLENDNVLPLARVAALCFCRNCTLVSPGLILQACPIEKLLPQALAFAEQQAPLCKGRRGREIFGSIKRKAKGQVLPFVLALRIVCANVDLLDRFRPW
eukprot:SAG31_NODE_11855_length_992_cov_0.856663_2_plen_156_part_00